MYSIKYVEHYTGFPGITLPVCASMLSFRTFMLPLLVPHLFFRCFGKAVLRDWDTPVFTYIFDCVCS